MMTSKNHSNFNIKLIDFGISVHHNQSEKLTQKIGTVLNYLLLKIINFFFFKPLYVAPEVLAGNYNEKCDDWSAGVIMYILLTGCPPFQGKTQSELLKAVKSGNFSKEISEYRTLSNEAKDLIESLMTVNPNKRISSEKALQHSWFVQIEKKETKNTQTETKNIVENLEKFRADRKIQLAVFYFFAHFLTLQEDKEKTMEMFRSMDKDSNGTLSREEILIAMKKSKNPLEADHFTNQIMKYGDINQNNKIDYSEFVAATIQKEKLLSIQKIQSVFNMFDKVKIKNCIKT